MEGVFILAVCETLELFHKTVGLQLPITVHCKQQWFFFLF